jgi:hypothetical protein
MRTDAETRKHGDAETITVSPCLRVSASPRPSSSLILNSFFFAALAIKFKTETRRATFLRKYPGPGGEWRIVSDMLAMPAIQDCTPVILIVFFKARDLLFHSSLDGRT